MGQWPWLTGMSISTHIISLIKVIMDDFIDRILIQLDLKVFRDLKSSMTSLVPFYTAHKP